jgi:DNA repair protein RadA/Sms
MEGTRPLLVEIQALVSYSELKSPRRVGNGISFNRLVVVCAILSKHLRLPLEKYDVYVNVSGGLKIDEPEADLACSLAIYSSFKNKALPKNACYLGELSLLGEIRSVANAERRIREATRMGFSTIFSKENYQSLKDLTNFLKG